MFSCPRLYLWSLQYCIPSQIQELSFIENVTLVVNSESLKLWLTEYTSTDYVTKNWRKRAYLWRCRYSLEVSCMSCQWYCVQISSVHVTILWGLGVVAPWPSSQTVGSPSQMTMLFFHRNLEHHEPTLNSILQLRCLKSSFFGAALYTSHGRTLWKFVCL